MKPIPAQRKGAHHTTAHAVRVASEQDARKAFDNARQRLIDVNRWHDVAGEGSAKFQVVDEEGKELEATVKEGNYLRITIQNIPATAVGDGDDWVKVEKIREENNSNYQMIAVRVRPAVPPFASDREIAHFFSPEATSTFCIERTKTKLRAAVYGRNEKPNTNASTLWAKIRNLGVAIGAMVGLNKSQWKSLVKGLVDKSL
ncbi:MAG: hypothetical protein H7Y42_13660 [Chitinophagaceae bacterium]|nr:hypothetical protein [Chitinophagaceae bacterium]